MREGTARNTLLDRSSPLRQRTADAETTPSRSPGAGWLFECETTQISHSFALLKQVRWWEEPAAWNYE